MGCVPLHSVLWNARAGVFLSIPPPPLCVSKNGHPLHTPLWSRLMIKGLVLGWCSKAWSTICWLIHGQGEVQPLLREHSPPTTIRQIASVSVLLGLCESSFTWQQVVCRTGWATFPLLFLLPLRMYLVLISRSNPLHSWNQLILTLKLSS